jgi:hypothetical protein
MGHPGDSSGVEEDSEPVVLEPLEAVAAALHLLDQEVEPLGGTVGGSCLVVAKDLGAPPPEGASQGLDLGDVVFGAAGDGLVQQGGGVGGLVGEVDVAD